MPSHGTTGRAAPITAAAVIAAFRAEDIALEPAGRRRSGTVFLRERPAATAGSGCSWSSRDAARRSKSVLAGARLPAGTGLVRFNELEVANVTVRSALWGRGGQW